MYVAEHGCKWRGLPKRVGNWHTICTRMYRWSKSGVPDRLFQKLQESQIVRIKIEAVSLDSTFDQHCDFLHCFAACGYSLLQETACHGWFFVISAYTIHSVADQP